MSLEDERPYPMRHVINLAQFALPDHQGPPSGKLKIVDRLRIPSDVTVQLAIPEFAVRRRPLCPRTTRMPVPETAVDEHHFSILGEHYVRLARKVGSVKTEPKAHAVQKAPYPELTLGVATFHMRHYAATCFLAESVRHWPPNWVIILTGVCRREPRHGTCCTTQIGWLQRSRRQRHDAPRDEAPDTVGPRGSTCLSPSRTCGRCCGP